MAKYISTKISQKQPAITPDDKGTVLVDRTSVAVDTSLAANDLILFGLLPSGCVPIGGRVLPTDLDSSTGIAFTIGILNDAGTDLVANTDFLTTSAAAQTGVSAALDNRLGITLAAINAVNTASDVGSNSSYCKHGDRVIAAKITTAATGTKAAGTFVLDFLYTAA